MMAINKSSVYGGRDFQMEREPDRFLHLHAKLKVFDEAETDRESSASSEDMESPRSVFRMRKGPGKNLSVRVHSQILRVREEDSHLGEDVFREYCWISSCRDKVVGLENVAAAPFSRLAALPASPLGGKTAIN